MTKLQNKISQTLTNSSKHATEPAVTAHNNGVTLSGLNVRLQVITNQT